MKSEPQSVVLAFYVITRNYRVLLNVMKEILLNELTLAKLTS